MKAKPFAFSVYTYCPICNDLQGSARVESAKQEPDRRLMNELPCSSCRSREAARRIDEMTRKLGDPS